jgi:hypothetical protein
MTDAQKAWLSDPETLEVSRLLVLDWGLTERDLYAAGFRWWSHSCDLAKKTTPAAGIHPHWIKP